MNSALLSSEKMDWETPQKLFDILDQKFNFTLDPAASKDNAKCKKYYTERENGLDKSWEGECVFLNPPYGSEIKKWVKKAYEESLKGVTIVMLVPARTDTSYWHDYIFGKASNITFLRGRITFAGAKHPAPFPSAIVVYNWSERLEEAER